MERSKIIMLVMIILPCLVTFSQAQKPDDSSKIQICMCQKNPPPCPNDLCFCCALEQDKCFRTSQECICGPDCPPLEATSTHPLPLP
uniref:Bowman-Birk serine protease inhibitors family domain-containing protein n=1 Tax=Aegilops tauschii subsp. strangulata TaxID=200361 RepID=A0A453HDN1_AEGTS